MKKVFASLLISFLLPIVAIESSYAADVPTIRLVTPELTPSNSLERTANDLQIGVQSWYRQGTYSKVTFLEVGSTLTLKYLVTKDGTTPWANTTLKLQVGSSYSGSTGTWSASGTAIPAQAGSWSADYGGLVTAVTDSQGVATFTLLNKDQEVKAKYSSQDVLNEVTLQTSAKDTRLYTQFKPLLNGFNDFAAPYELSDIITFDIVRKPTESEKAAAAELKAKQEAELKAAAELKAKQEAELKAKQEAEVKAAAELKAKQEAELKAAAELKAKQEAEAKAAAELKAKQEAEAKAAAEAAALANAKSEAERLAAQAAIAKSAAEAKAKQEAEAKAAAELKAKQEAEAKAAAELKAKQEAEAKAAAELKAKQEEEARMAAIAAAEARAKQEAEAKAAAEAKAKLVPSVRLILPAYNSSSSVDTTSEIVQYYTPKTKAWYSYIQAGSSITLTYLIATDSGTVPLPNQSVELLVNAPYSGSNANWLFGTTKIAPPKAVDASYGYKLTGKSNDKGLVTFTIKNNDTKGFEPKPSSLNSVFTAPRLFTTFKPVLPGFGDKDADIDLLTLDVYAAPAVSKKSVTISCIKKGSATKKVTGVNPKCPSGYTKK